MFFTGEEARKWGEEGKIAEWIQHFLRCEEGEHPNPNFGLADGLLLEERFYTVPMLFPLGALNTVRVAKDLTMKRNWPVSAAGWIPSCRICRAGTCRRYWRSSATAGCILPTATTAILRCRKAAPRMAGPSCGEPNIWRRKPWRIWLSSLQTERFSLQFFCVLVKKTAGNPAVRGENKLWVSMCIWNISSQRGYSNGASSSFP